MKTCITKPSGHVPGISRYRAEHKRVRHYSDGNCANWRAHARSKRDRSNSTFATCSQKSRLCNASLRWLMWSMNPESFLTLTQSTQHWFVRSILKWEGERYSSYITDLIHLPSSLTILSNDLSSAHSRKLMVNFSAYKREHVWEKRKSSLSWLSSIEH